MNFCLLSLLITKFQGLLICWAWENFSQLACTRMMLLLHVDNDNWIPLSVCLLRSRMCCTSPRTTSDDFFSSQLTRRKKREDGTRKKRYLLVLLLELVSWTTIFASFHIIFYDSISCFILLCTYTSITFGSDYIHVSTKRKNYIDFSSLKITMPAYGMDIALNRKVKERMSCCMFCWKDIYAWDGMIDFRQRENKMISTKLMLFIISDED